MFDYNALRDKFKEDKEAWASVGSPIAMLNKFFEQVDAPFQDDKDRVEIIVLKYKNPEVEIDCVADIIRNTEFPYKLTLFDNRPNTANTSKAWNKLIREATCEMVVVMDSDVFVQKGWLEPLVDAIRKPECGMAVPVVGTSAAANVQQMYKEDRGDFDVQGHVSGCCFITTKTIIEKIGWFDENYLVFGQDSDMCNRLHLSNKKIHVCPRSLVYHGKKNQQHIADVKQDWVFSLSTRKAADEGEFDWGIDTKFAGFLTNKKMEKYRNVQSELEKEIIFEI